MEVVIIVALIGIVGMLFVGYFLGKKHSAQGSGNAELVVDLRNQLAALQKKASQMEEVMDRNAVELRQTIAEREVQKTYAATYKEQLDKQKADYTNALSIEKERHLSREAELKQGYDQEVVSLKTLLEKQKSEELERMQHAYDSQISELKMAQDKQLAQNKESAEKQIEALKKMNQEQVENQLNLIKEQMQTTSEEILKRRQEELGARNEEQVSKIIDPLQQSLKAMQEAFNLSKEQQSDALARLDETIKINMQKSVALGETADRLTRALTGEVKVQGNFGELKLKQLLEDLQLKEGEQFDTQETLRDAAGKVLKGDDGKGLIPDFILHFPNNRHIVVDSKMSLTAYERYMNTEDGSEEKAQALKAHLLSVRQQVNRLAGKQYSKYLPSGYNRLNFVIMYIPIEGALNLAMFNDATLWKDAYDEGVMILGPQTMYMNLRVLEMMWTQVRQLQNQDVMIKAANSIIERVQDFGTRFLDVEASMHNTFKKMSHLKVVTADGGPSIITAAKQLVKAGASENKKKKSLNDLDNSIFIETEQTQLLDKDLEEALPVD